MRVTNSAETEQSMHRLEVETLFRRQSISVLGNFFLSTMAATALWNMVSHRIMLLWLSVVLLVAMWRYLNTYRYFKLLYTDHSLKYWNNIYVTGAGASGICWGILSWLVPDTPDAINLVVIIQAALIAYGTIALSLSRVAMVIFLLCTVIPLIARLVQTERLSLPYAILSLLFLIITFIAVMSQRSGERLARQRREITLEFQRQKTFLELVEKFPDAVVRYDLQLRRIYVNPEWERINGIPSEQALDKTPTELGSPTEPYAEECEEKLAQVIATGESDIFIIDWRNGGGESCCLEMRAIPEFDENGQIVGLLAVTRDISERSRMEKELANREREFRSLAESSPDVVARYDLEGRHLYVNSHLLRVVGYAHKEELIGKRIEEIWPDGRYDEIVVAAKKAVKTGQPVCIELTKSDGIGGDIYSLIHVLPERNADDEIIGTIAFGRDLTQHYKTIQLLDQVQKISNIGSWDWDIVNDHVECSETALNIYALHGHVDHLSYEFLLQSVHPDDKDRVMAAMEAAVRDGKPYNVDHRIISDVQGVRVVREQGRVFHDVQGHPVRMVGTVQDITESHQAEEALQRNEQLLRSVIDATPDWIFIKDLQHRYQLVNQGYADALHISPEDFIGKNDLELGFPEELVKGNPEKGISGFWADDQKVIETNKTNIYPNDLATVDGRIHTFHTIKTPLVNSESQPWAVLAFARDISELVEYREKIFNLAFFDIVTGLANRVLFNDKLIQALSDAAKGSSQLAVVMLDLDRFKEVNDTMGHYVGDKLLVAVAERLSASVRDIDTVARFGGDEYAVLLPDFEDVSCIEAIAETILAKLSEAFFLEGRDVFVAASIGISIYPEDSDQADNLIKYADLAMYEAKKAGGNCFCHYHEELTARVKSRMKIETELRRALERDEFELYYQPKVDIARRCVVGSEALLRWNSTKFGLMAPDSFIHIAEDTLMIISIGEWVLYEACRTACEWNGPGKPLHKIAVNLSPCQFYSSQLGLTVEKVLRDTGCLAEWIELEITETLLLDNTVSVRNELESLRQMGFSIAIDDFGTGYSALNYLTNFPIDVLKIDRSFVRDMLSNHSKAELVKAIITMANSLQMDVVSEGVEREEQAEFLLNNGCLYAQGYLYGKPVPKTA